MSNVEDSLLENAPLGRDVTYPEAYDATVLFPLPRQEKRDALGLVNRLPFTGVDIWTGYELSWLNAKGKPVVAIAEFAIPYNSPNIIESKSFKLYLNSFMRTRFKSLNAVHETLARDLSAAAGLTVIVKLYFPEDFYQLERQEFSGLCIDHLDVEIDDYQLNPEHLYMTNKEQNETLFSNLLKSNCPITNQPDWATIMIRYHGNAIDRAGLLRYLISYREHAEFHEQCVERIYVDLMERCRPRQLTVYARYTRRGGLDINPFRSNFETPPTNRRTGRQ